MRSVPHLHVLNIMLRKRSYLRETLFGFCGRTVRAFWSATLRYPFLPGFVRPAGFLAALHDGALVFYKHLDDTRVLSRGDLKGMWLHAQLSLA